MITRFSLVILVSAVAAAGVAIAQNKIHTQTIRPPVVGGSEPKAPNGARKASSAVEKTRLPIIIKDLSRLPPAVARTRERILAAARSGELANVVAVMHENRQLPVFSFSVDKDPVGFWKSNYPDSNGIEILSILTTVLETAYVHVDQGTQQEIYLWPYFARMPLKSLTPPQKVELFRIVTGADYKEMIEFGAYSFYRVGIGPDGTWHFFVAGDGRSLANVPIRKFARSGGTL